LLNVVLFAEGRIARDGDPDVPGAADVPGDVQGWDHAAVAADLQAAVEGVCQPLRALVEALQGWRAWQMFDRAPLRSAREMARGRVALLGDAAHPMLPFLAQGAGMAIEDAAVLAQSLALCPELEVHEALARYARLRWGRVARVQARARRNGEIFHATGPVRVARDLSMRMLGEKLLDMPWLYGARV
jgi:salicylate hydroxylase